MELAAGEVLLRKGEKANALYGRRRLLRATTIRDGGGELTFEFGPGEMAGEMAILVSGGKELRFRG